MSAKLRAKPPAGNRGATRHTILVVDDHPIVREGLRRLIDQQRDLTVCGEAESFSEAQAAIRKLKPALVIIDISLRQGDGLELVKEARAKNPRLLILVLSMHDEVIYAERVLAAGANGYIMKQAQADELLLAVRRVLSGNIYVSQVIANSMLAAGGRQAATDPMARLSNRELQILQMIGTGLSTRQTAEALSLSMKTIETHRERIKRKLHLATGSQLVQYAVNWSDKSDAGIR